MGKLITGAVGGATQANPLLSSAIGAFQGAAGGGQTGGTTGGATGGGSGPDVAGTLASDQQAVQDGAAITASGISRDKALASQNTDKTKSQVALNQIIQNNSATLQAVQATKVG